jgi:hypothetical protein
MCRVALSCIHATIVAVEKRSKYVFIPLGMQHAMSMGLIVVFSLSGCTTFVQMTYLINGMTLEQNVLAVKCVLTLNVSIPLCLVNVLVY